jgi:hypothetical protein
MRDKVLEAHIPTWLRIQLLSASRGRRADASDASSYLDTGYHLGRHHLDDFCEDLDRAYHTEEREVLNHPTRVLRRIFASDEHPRGELTDLIPLRRRRSFLLGVLAGVAEERPGDYWLSRAGQS